MTWDIGVLIALMVVALLLFSWDRVPADVVALGLVLSLVFTGLLPSDKAFAGFGSDTVIMILGLLILVAALMRTGVVEIAGRAILRHTGDSPFGLLMVIMVGVASMSAFMSNTAATAFFLPVVIGLTKRAGLHPRQFLLPLAFASILSSSVTLISTSTNLVVSGLMTNYKLAPLGMFELSPVGIPIALVGLAYMSVVGLLWMRSNKQAPEAKAEPTTYLSEVVVLPESRLVGKTLTESKLGEDLDVTVVRLVRAKTQYLAPHGEMTIRAGDVLLVEGKPDTLLRIKDTAGIEIKADYKLGDPNLPAAELGIVEVILLNRSPLLGRTLKGIGFREHYGLQVLGISRHGSLIDRKISQVRLRTGDILLMQGSKSNIAALEADRSFRIIQALDEQQPNRKRALTSVIIFVGVMALATAKVLPLSVAVILGAVLCFATKCITPDEAYRELEWKAVILIGAMLALGTAMESTGAAKYLATQLMHLAGDDPVPLLATFFILTVLLTQPMSNQAAAVVILPIAIQTAIQLGYNPRTFAVMVAVAASCSYLTPLEPSCLMVYGPGEYRFRDFLKVGSVLTLIIGGLALWLVPRFWPVHI